MGRAWVCQPTSRQGMMSALSPPLPPAICCHPPPMTSPSGGKGVVGGGMGVRWGSGGRGGLWMRSGWSEKARAQEWKGGQGGGSSVGHAGTVAAWRGGGEARGCHVKTKLFLERCCLPHPELTFATTRRRSCFWSAAACRTSRRPRPHPRLLPVLHYATKALLSAG